LLTMISYEGLIGSNSLLAGRSGHVKSQRLVEVKVKPNYLSLVN
jgi:hypothetical protein